jgi:hypothetical protein
MAAWDDECSRLIHPNQISHYYWAYMISRLLTEIKMTPLGQPQMPSGMNETYLHKPSERVHVRNESNQTNAQSGEGQ